MAMLVGGDLEQLGLLEQQFRVDAEAVAELRSRISGLLAATAWTGPAADRFRHEWSTSFSSAMANLSAALQENAVLVAGRRQAIAAATS